MKPEIADKKLKWDKQASRGEYREQKELLCNYCKRFYNKGWVSGTGGGMTIKVTSELALIAPSGVQKEEIAPKDLFLIDLSPSTDEAYEIVSKPDNLKISACTSIFVNIFKNRETAGAVIHSHSMSAVMLTKTEKNPTVTIARYEMLKGLAGGTYFGEHTLPILDNVEHECELAEAVGQAVLDHPKAHAVLVRDHGVYIWGRDAEQAKIHAECYDYLFEAVVRERQLKALNLI